MFVLEAASNLISHIPSAEMPAGGGVYLWLVYPRLGHGRQDLYSPCAAMHGGDGLGFRGHSLPTEGSR